MAIRTDHICFPHDPRVEAPPAGNAFIEGVYTRWSPVYDLVFGAALQPGRRIAVARLAIRPGDRVLEVGAGTGLNAPLYPRHCCVTAVDLSLAMLHRARKRMLGQRLSHVRLLGADAARLAFPDAAFDGVCAPYVISVVPDPGKVVREMLRVCRPGGRVVIVNHFHSSNAVVAGVERVIAPITLHLGFRSDLSLRTLLREAGVRPLWIERVNYPPIWTVVTWRKD